MGKELLGQGKSSLVAEEMVTNKEVDKTPGKVTNVDDREAYNLLSPEERQERYENTKDRILAAGGYCNDGIEAAKTHILLKKPEQLPMWLGMIIEVAFDMAGDSIMKAIGKIKTGKIKLHSNISHDAIMGGHFDKANKADASRQWWQSLSEEALKKRIKLVSGSAKWQARPAVAAALADSQEKADQLNYIAQLQMGMTVAFQTLREEGLKGCSDAELTTLFHAFDAVNHQSDFYQKAILEKVKRFMNSGVERIGKDSVPIEDGGKREWIGDLEVERRVVWVKDPKGEKTLWYHEKAETHSNARSVEIARKQGHNGQYKLTKPVPREFWGEAIEKNENESGQKVGTLEDSPETRAVLGVRQDYAQRMQTAKVSHGNDQKQEDSGAIAATNTYNKLFGGM